MWLKVLFLVVVAICGTTDSACRVDLIKSQLTELGSIQKYCWYNSMKLQPGSQLINLSACENVTCTEELLSVCLLGKNAGISIPRPGCAVVQDGCKAKMVSLTCPSQK